MTMVIKNNVNLKNLYKIKMIAKSKKNNQKKTFGCTHTQLESTSLRNLCFLLEKLLVV